MNPSLPKFVLDTNVLLYDPEAMLAYPQGEIVIPIDVIEEIDKFKNVLSETGNNARIVSHRLDEYRQKGNLSEGIELPNNGRLRVEFSAYSIKDGFHDLNLEKSSNRVLTVALHLKRRGDETRLITQDTNLRVKANAFGLDVCQYEGEQTVKSSYKGLRRQRVSLTQLQALQKLESFPWEGDFLANEGLLLEVEDNPKQKILARFDKKSHSFHRVGQEKGIWDIAARNPEQQYALEMLLNPDISIVTLVGKAGTGKTLLALAVGLHLMLVENRYSRLLVSRPIFPMGRDLGYLPGNIDEKLAPWMQPIFDNLELLISSSPKASEMKKKGYHELIEQGLLVIEPLTYIRGRSIPHQYMIVDESQNLTPHEMKTIVTRVGEGTKIVLTGDPDQIDNPYLNGLSNGLSYAVEKFKPFAISGHVSLIKGERSQLAELASNIL